MAQSKTTRKHTMAAVRPPSAEPDPRIVDDVLELYRRMLSLGDSAPEATEIGRQLRARGIEIIENCFYIVDKLGNRRLLKLRPGQRRLIQHFIDCDQQGIPIRALSLKARQKGISTAIASWNFLQLITRFHFPAAVMAHVKGAGQNIFRIYDRFRKYFDPRFELRRATGSSHGRSFTLEGLDSTITVLVSTEAKGDDIGSAGRSDTLGGLHLSEVPFYNNASATMNALKQCVHHAPGTTVVLESTAKAWGDEFHNEWLRAEQGKTAYERFFVPWFEDDEYTLPFESKAYRARFESSLNHFPDDEFGDEVFLIEHYDDEGMTLEHLNWRRTKIANDHGGSVEHFQREFPCTPDEAFQQARGNWLNPSVMTIYAGLSKPPIAIGDFAPQMGSAPPQVKPERHGWVHIWDHPEPYAEYVIGSDTAEGTQSGDFNCAYVYRRLPAGIVAEIRGRDFRPVGETAFAYQLYWAALYYNRAWINPESNRGQVIRTVLEHELAYDHLLRSRDIQFGGLRLSRNPSRVGWWNAQPIVRWATTTAKEWFEGAGSTKDLEPQYCPSMGLIMEARNAVLRDNRVVAPRKGMTRSPGDPEEGYYDDRLFAFFGCLIADHALPEAGYAEDNAERQQEREYDELDAELRRALGDHTGDTIGGLLPRAWTNACVTRFDRP